MRFDGIHHVTCITAEAPRNVDFYTRVLGLRLVKKTVNQDDPTVYHLFYADEEGHAGSDITFFEYPDAQQGEAGNGMVHTVVWRVGSADALEFWAGRLSAEGHEVEADGQTLRFVNPEGLQHELVVSHVADEPLVAHHPEIPRDVALQGFEGVRAYGETDGEFMTTLGFELDDGRWDTRAETRGGWIEYGQAPEAPGIGGAGTVHHVAWSSTMEDHQAWRDLVQDAGAHPTQIIDRFWFRSIYFREPAGVLFEIATLGPGFAADEEPAHLGEKLILPPAFEHLRDRVEPVLTPLPDPAGGLVPGLSLEVRERPVAGEAAGALVLLHGRGADENDLFPLLDALDPERRLHGYTPRGPLSLPPGGAHWYVLGGIGTPERETFAASYASLTEFLDGLPYERLVLGGFSQGCAMAYALALYRGRPRPDALLAMSGFIPSVDGYELDLEPPFPRIAIVHGAFDPVIPVQWGREARDLLEGAGAAVLYRESPIEHWIDADVIPPLREVVAG